MRPIRVLLVDDYVLLRELLSKILTPDQGFEVVGQASDGFEAVNKAEALQPDLVLMDMNMPRCDGLEATKLIKERWPDTRVVILTSYPEEARVLQALSIGAAASMAKSFTIPELMETLRNIVKEALPPRPVFAV